MNKQEHQLNGRRYSTGEVLGFLTEFFGGLSYRCQNNRRSETTQMRGHTQTSIITSLAWPILFHGFIQWENRNKITHSFPLFMDTEPAIFSCLPHVCGLHSTLFMTQSSVLKNLSTRVCFAFEVTAYKRQSVQLSQEKSSFLSDWRQVEEPFSWECIDENLIDWNYSFFIPRTDNNGKKNIFVTKTLIHCHETSSWSGHAWEYLTLERWPGDLSVVRLWTLKSHDSLWPIIFVSVTRDCDLFHRRLSFCSNRLGNSIMITVRLFSCKEGYTFCFSNFLPKSVTQSFQSSSTASDYKKATFVVVVHSTGHNKRRVTKGMSWPRDEGIAFACLLVFPDPPLVLLIRFFVRCWKGPLLRNELLIMMFLPKKMKNHIKSTIKFMLLLFACCCFPTVLLVLSLFMFFLHHL